MPFSNIGGTERATLRLAEAAAHCGFENTLYCPRGAEDLKRFYHGHAFSTASYDQVEPSYHHPLPYLRASQALAHDMKRRHVRIVHCADILGAHYAAMAGRLAGAYVVSHVRCQHCSITRRDQTFLYPVQKFVFVSKSTWDTFGMNVPPEKAQVLYDGVPAMDSTDVPRVEIRSRYGLPPDAPVVGMASRVHPCKDFESLILAAKIVAQTFPACRYLIAGDYEREPAHREHFRNLRQMLEETGMSDRFVFAGYEADMPQFFSAIDLFVLSSHGEGLPLVILEAMSAGKAVVATDVGGVREAVQDQQTGLLVPESSPEALAEALLALLGNPERLESFARAAREVGLRDFSEKLFQRRVKELYCAIARQQGLVGSYAPCTPM